MQFRTPTGQTGRDAYIYEAAQIANAQRELDARMRRLCQAVYDEHPELLKHDTDYHPMLGVDGTGAQGFLEYLKDPACGCPACARRWRVQGVHLGHEYTTATVRPIAAA